VRFNRTSACFPEYCQARFNAIDAIERSAGRSDVPGILAAKSDLKAARHRLPIDTKPVVGRSARLIGAATHEIAPAEKRRVLRQTSPDRVGVTNHI
jgi:hypothetical protein